VSAALFRTSLFLSDYAEVAIRISESNPEAAERFCEAVEAALNLLSQHPQIGPFVRFPRAPRTRHLILPAFPAYAIYYEDRPAEIVLIRLLHGSRDAAALIPDS